MTKILPGITANFALIILMIEFGHFIPQYLKLECYH